MNTEQKRAVDFRIVGIVSIVAVVFAIAPRLLPEIELPRRSALWVPALHQVFLAAMISYIAWQVSGRRRSVALLCAGLILIVWGPNIAGAIEYSLTGENNTVFAVAERVGITPLLNTVYSFLYDALGYSFSIAASQ